MVMACDSGKKISSSAPSNADLESNYDTEGLNANEVSEIEKLLGTFENEVGWPARPRRSMNITDTTGNSTVFSVGLKFDMFGASLESSIKPKFAMDLKTTVMMVRTSPGGTEDLIVEEGEELKLNYQDGIDFVYFCTYSASVTAGMAWESKIGLFGSGVTNTSEITETIEVVQGSQFVEISTDDDLKSIKGNCHDIFVKTVKKTVVNDLKKIIKASVGFDTQAGESPINLIAKAANEGPQLNGAVFEGVTYNIPKVDEIIKKAGNETQIIGRVIRHRKLVGGIPTTGLTIPYNITFLDGAIIQDNSYDDPKEEIGIRLGKRIAEDIYNNSRKEAE